MAIYTPEHFAGRDVEPALALIREHPFATLITAAGDAPQVTYVPLLLEDGELRGHLARANPHWRKFAGGPTLALFHGPHAFVSPHWYEKPADNVPTWNYAVVHVHGHASIDADGDTRAHLERLAARFDGRGLPTEPERLERLLGVVVAFRMPIERIEAKFKMSQNKTAADRAGVIAGLRASGRADGRAVAEWMERHAGA